MSIVRESLVGLLVVPFLVGLDVLLWVVSAIETAADAHQRIAREMEAK